MNKFTKYFCRNFSFFLVVFFLLIAGLNLFQKNYAELINSIMFAFFNFLLGTNLNEINYYLEFLSMTLNVSTRQMKCIVDLAHLAGPAVGYDKVLAILEAHNIDIKKLWDDFDDKRNNRLRKRLEMPVPEWVADLKIKVSQEMAQHERS